MEEKQSKVALTNQHCLAAATITSTYGAVLNRFGLEDTVENNYALMVILLANYRDYCDQVRGGDYQEKMIKSVLDNSKGLIESQSTRMGWVFGEEGIGSAQNN